MNDELETLRRELQQVGGALPNRIDVDAEGVEKGLAQLVLTLVEFLRQLLAWKGEVSARRRWSASDSH
jgi:hypothetical protein